MKHVKKVKATQVKNTGKSQTGGVACVPQGGEIKR